MPYETKYYTKITIELGSVPGNWDAFLFSRRAHLLTTCRKAGGGILPASGSCALRGDFRFLRKAMDDAGKLLSSTQQARDGTKCSILACCLRKPATGSFAADMGASICRCTHFLFCERETEIGEGTVKANGNLPFGSEGNQQRRRPLCCCCRSLYELQRDL